MNLSGSLWCTSMRPESIVGDWGLCSRSWWFFLIVIQLLFFRSHLQKFLLLGIFSNMLSMCISKVGVIIEIIHMIYLVEWVFKAYWVHFRLMTSKCSNCIFGMAWERYIGVFVEVFSCWSMFMVFLKYMFSLWLFLGRKWASEWICLQFSIMLHKEFSHSFFVKFTFMTVFHNLALLII